MTRTTKQLPLGSEDTRAFICEDISREYILIVMDILQDASDGIAHTSSPGGKTYDLYLQGADEERIGEEEIAAWGRFVAGVLAALEYQRKTPWVFVASNERSAR